MKKTIRVLYGSTFYKPGDRLYTALGIGPIRAADARSVELDPFGYYTVDGLDLEDGLHGPYSGGWYALTCLACGSQTRLHQRLIHARLKRQHHLIYSCGCKDREWDGVYGKITPLPGRQPSDLTGRTYGRLEVIASEKGVHTCLCGCGAIEIHRSANVVRYEGARNCRHMLAKSKATAAQRLPRTEK